ncbi:hypothetical protein GQ44DRAFT_772569 [Phaeosphaeriaceae sp. PMI808]|nr:hypothetical protein GQ44DRAFT_772569 [Phaeosphaeriaceae sp. PMI808]
MTTAHAEPRLQLSKRATFPVEVPPSKKSPQSAQSTQGPSNAHMCASLSTLNTPNQQDKRIAPNSSNLLTVKSVSEAPLTEGISRGQEQHYCPGNNQPTVFMLSLRHFDDKSIPIPSQLLPPRLHPDAVSAYGGSGLSSAEKSPTVQAPPQFRDDIDPRPPSPSSNSSDSDDWGYPVCPS